MSSWTGMLSTTAKRSPAPSILSPSRFSSSRGHTSPAGTSYRALTTPSTPGICWIRGRLTGSPGPNQRKLINTGQTPLKTLKPPSTGITAPVTNDAVSLASHRTVPATSSGLPSRPIGVCSMMRFARSV